MNFLEERIAKDGVVKPGNVLKVDSFLNHQMDPGSKENGGLYENVYPGQTVTAFNDWCFDAARVSGDTAIVETEYGCHVMYFVGNSDMTYRDFMIESTLRNADLSAWESGLIEAAELEVLNTKYVRTDMVLNANQ